MAEYKLSHFPVILDENTGQLAYGGTQEWFDTFWKRQAGCAATSGANLAAFYEILEKPEKNEAGLAYYQKEDFLQIMNAVYHYMQPGIMGFPKYEKYIEAFLDFAQHNGKSFQTAFAKGWSSEKESVDFVSTALHHDQPVAMLILTHRAPELRENTWHWMTITGYNDENGQITISNYGKKEVLSASTVFEPHVNNDVKLITFKPLFK